MEKYFQYGDEAVNYLKKKDKKLAAVIDAIGHIDRPVDTDLFSSVIHHIIGQQISTKAQATIWARMQETLGEVTAESILSAGAERIQAFGTSHRKAGYICEFASRVAEGKFDPQVVSTWTDEEVIRELSELSGIGVWTAEMIMLFGMQRQDVLSYRDLAIIRGMRMVYRHREIGPERFERLRRRYSPYGSVASLYLWAVAGGAIPGLTDPEKRRRS